MHFSLKLYLDFFQLFYFFGRGILWWVSLSDSKLNEIKKIKCLGDLFWFQTNESTSNSHVMLVGSKLIYCSNLSYLISVDSCDCLIEVFMFVCAGR